MPSEDGEAPGGGGWGSFGGGIGGYTGTGTSGYGTDTTGTPGGLDGAPDVGTIGGTLSDGYGENSSTMGGGTSNAQSDANNEVNQNSWGYDFGSAGLTDPGAWGLGSLFGYQSPTGLPTNEGGQFGGNASSYGMSDFATSPFSKALRSLMGMTPFGKVANMGIDAAMGKPMSQIAANAVPGLPGVVARAGVQAANSPNPTASLGKSALGYGLGTLGSNVGYGVAGPIGGMLGGMAGSAAAGMTGGPAKGSSGGLGGTGGGSGWEQGLTTLANLYGGYQGIRNANQLQDNANASNAALQGQMSSLAGMYAPDSPYAKQLAQQLARKDAASGRNSQYGNRAVELQARLAALAPTVANSMAGLGGQMNTNYTNSNAANNASQLAKAQMLKQLIGVGSATGFNQWASDGLSNLFSSNSAPPPPAMDDGTQWT